MSLSDKSFLDYLFKRVYDALNVLKTHTLSFLKP